MKTSVLLGLLFLGLSSNLARASTDEAIQIQTYDNQTLNGFWTLPDGAVTGAVLILQGSGHVAADGDVSGPTLGFGYQGQSAKLSEEIADQLASIGVASLRYSKRGVDDPTQLPNQTIPYLKSDAESALTLLQAKFPGVKTGVVGLSEGATLATLVSNDMQVDALFLLSLPTRAIDEVLSYQYFDWPTELLMSRLDPNQTGFITAAQFQEAGVTTLPQMGASWSALDTNQDQQLSVTTELLPAYQSFYNSMRGLLKTPTYQGWYQSFLVIPSFAQVASHLKTGAVFVYQGMDDAQVRWNWILEDSNFISITPNVHLFPNVGHCFSPMDGTIGEIKTSGPLSNDLLQQLSADVATGLK